MQIVSNIPERKWKGVFSSMDETEDRSGMSDEEQKRYVSDVGDTGSVLQSALTELLKLLPLMWTGQLRGLETLKVVAEIRAALVEGVSNVEILEAYLREWIKAGKKGQTLSLADARTMVLKARAEDIVKAVTFDDDTKFTYTTSDNFPESDTPEEQRRWMLRAYAEFETSILGFVKNVSEAEKGT